MGEESSGAKRRGAGEGWSAGVLERRSGGAGGRGG